MTECNVGILALQGDVTENFMATMAALHDAGIDATVSQVKTPDQISKLDGLIIPGGESTMTVSYTHLTLPTNREV